MIQPMTSIASPQGAPGRVMPWPRIGGLLAVLLAVALPLLCVAHCALLHADHERTGATAHQHRQHQTQVAAAGNGKMLHAAATPLVSLATMCHELSHDAPPAVYPGVLSPLGLPLIQPPASAAVPPPPNGWDGPPLPIPDPPPRLI